MNKNEKLNTYYISGFSDGESCFSVMIQKDKRSKTGWVIQPVFTIILSSPLRANDLILLNRYEAFFELGRNYDSEGNSVAFIIESLFPISPSTKLKGKKGQDIIMVIIPQFDKYPLLTQKRADFLLFKSIVKMISVPSGERKEYLNHNDLQEIVKIQASMNSGAVRWSEKLTERFRALFPSEISGCPHEGYSSALCEGKKIKSVPSSEVQFTGIPDSHWFTGFTDAEGCFMIKIQQSSSSILNTQPRLIFRITQHSRDLELMKSLVEYFDCGYYYPDSNLDHGDFVVIKFSDIYCSAGKKILPFCASASSASNSLVARMASLEMELKQHGFARDKYPLQGAWGVSPQDYADFRKLAQLIKDKAYLTKKGLDQILKIKAGMKIGRSCRLFFAVDEDCNHLVFEFRIACGEKSLRDSWLHPALSLAFTSAERGMEKFKDALLAMLEKNNIFTIYYFFPLSISLNLNLLFKYLIKYLNYDKFLENLLRYFFKSEFENFSNILGEFFKIDAHLFLNYFLYIVNWGPCFIIIGWLGFSIGRIILKFYYY